MTTAFLATAFQNNAFQIDGITPSTGGGGGGHFYSPRHHKRKKLERDTLSEAIRASLDPPPAFAPVVPEPAKPEPPKRKAPLYVPEVLRFEPPDLAPVAEAISAIIVQQQAQAMVQAEQQQDDEEAMALIEALLL